MTTLRAYAPAPVESNPPAPSFVDIAPSEGWFHLDFHDLWHYRELLYFLTWRDIKVRYKQTALGVLWAILQPVLMMLIFSLFFGKLGKLPSDGIPYPLFNFSALVPWLFFANGLSQSSNSLVGNANLISKVYFPRLIIPVATVLTGVVDFVLSMVVLVGMMAIYHVVPTRNVIWLPLLLLLALVTSLGAGLWFSALNVKYRDVRYIVPFLVQLWMFATPVAYSSHMLSGWKHTVYSLNPMVGVVDGFRWALLGTHTQPNISVAMAVLVAVAMLVGGLCYFRHMEKSFADIV